VLSGIDDALLPLDPAAWSRALARLATDAGARAAMRERLKARAIHFGPAAQDAAYAALYRDIVRAAPARRRPR
jgi:hypothetical protein